MIELLTIRLRGSPIQPGPGLEAVRREFPTVRLGFEAHAASGPAISLEQWRDPKLDFFALDAIVFGALDSGARGILLDAPPEQALALAVEVLTRYQSAVGRRNRCSGTPTFDAVLERHRALHDLTKPLVRADHRHALDAWQWLLRLAPDASFALQVATLFHDIERLTSEADRRIEHHAADYLSFKEAHARGGAAVVVRELSGFGLEPRELARIAELVAKHERPGPDEELALLNDADALSFFSLNSYGYLSYFGAEQTAKKVDYTLRRLRPHQRAHLRGCRLPNAIARMIEAASALQEPEREVRA